MSYIEPYSYLNDQKNLGLDPKELFNKTHVTNERHVMKQIPMLRRKGTSTRSVDFNNLSEQYFKRKILKKESYLEADSDDEKSIEDLLTKSRQRIQSFDSQIDPLYAEPVKTE